MSPLDGLLFCLIYGGSIAVAVLAMLVISRARTLAELLRPFRDIWLGLRFMLWEMPLRAITGRKRPDHQRIAVLEGRCDLRNPWPDAQRAMATGRFSISDGGLDGIHIQVDESVPPDLAEQWLAAWDKHRERPTVLPPTPQVLPYLPRPR